MLKVQCTSCSYSFNVKDHVKVPHRCPYCSTSGSVRKVKLMQEWINDVSQAQENFVFR